MKSGSMRIAVVGSHSTGKTTLVRALSAYLNIPVLTEVAREKIAESDKLPHHMTPEERSAFQGGVLAEQIRRETAAEKFLSDRSVFDAAAYAFDTPGYENLFETARNHATGFPYEKIFFLPIEFPLEGDGIRNEDEAYRKKVEDVLAATIERSGTPYVRITGSREERLAACLESLGIDFGK